jgi:Na+-transporting NADH:ubiquinone oxidoreductase subunit C
VPVRGTAYQSTLKGYLALKADLNTVAALTFYEQAETPGLGARIEEDAWQALWPGKKVADADGVIRIEVVKGAGKGVHEVDGISGATRTGTGVTNLLQFWLGPDGYGPYLDRLRLEARR